VSAPHFKLKGSGWYETDFKNKPKPEDSKKDNENTTKITKTGSDIYAQAGLKMGDTGGWEFNLFLESTKLAEVDLDPISQKLKYSLDGEINNNFGFKFINHSMDNLGYSVGLSHDGFSGLSTSVGVRVGL
jgi:hypothetical protein